MWSLYQQAATWQTRPSDLFGIPDECDYLRYVFDEAVLYFGRSIDSKLDERYEKGPHKGKRKHTLQQLLSDNPQPRTQSIMALAALGGVEIR